MEEFIQIRVAIFNGPITRITGSNIFIVTPVNLALQNDILENVIHLSAISALSLNQLRIGQLIELRSFSENDENPFEIAMPFRVVNNIPLELDQEVTTRIDGLLNPRSIRTIRGIPLIRPQRIL